MTVQPGPTAADTVLGRSAARADTVLDRSAAMADTVVHLVRHGEVANPTGVLYGRLPGFDLSPAGRLMAERVAAHLAGADITYLATSPLARAQQTAAPLAAAIDLVPTIDDRLTEAASTFEGGRVTGPDGALRNPRNWPALRNPLQPSWGEPYVLIARRMLGAVFAAVDAAVGHQAVLVSHQLPIWTLRRLLTGRRLWHHPARRECALASVTSLSFADGVLTGIGYATPASDVPLTVWPSRAADRTDGAVTSSDAAAPISPNRVSPTPVSPTPVSPTPARVAR